jgi:selenium metabolism protein YedF
MKQISVKGLACPQPVIETKNALQRENETFMIVSDSSISAQNIQKFLNANGVSFVLREQNGDYTFEVTPSTKDITASQDCIIAKEQKTLLFTSDTIGSDEVLGKQLAKGFITALVNSEVLPQNIFFINAGVKLSTSEDLQIIDALKELEKVGVKIYSCGLCLEHYGIANSLKVGQSGNALQTLQTLIDSQNTVTLG